MKKNKLIELVEVLINEFPNLKRNDFIFILDISYKSASIFFSRIKNKERYDNFISKYLEENPITKSDEYLLYHEENNFVFSVKEYNRFTNAFRVYGFHDDYLILYMMSKNIRKSKTDFRVRHKIAQQFYLAAKTLFSECQSFKLTGNTQTQLIHATDKITIGLSSKIEVVHVKYGTDTISIYLREHLNYGYVLVCNNISGMVVNAQFGGDSFFDCIESEEVGETFRIIKSTLDNLQMQKGD